jgi:hypothetical protein
MSTRIILQTSIRLILDDVVIWPDNDLLQWINDAITDYCNYFPEEYINDLTVTSTGTIFDLPAAALGVTRVEYPVSQVPPHWLHRMRMDSPFFYNNYEVYELIGDPPAQIRFGYVRPGNLHANITILRTLTMPAADSSDLGIPDSHNELLRIYVIWQAMRKLELAQAGTPVANTILLSEYGTDAGRLQRLYFDRIRALMAGRASGGFGTTPWKLDDHDRVY